MFRAPGRPGGASLVARYRGSGLPRSTSPHLSWGVRKPWRPIWGWVKSAFGRPSGVQPDETVSCSEAVSSDIGRQYTCAIFWCGTAHARCRPGEHARLAQPNMFGCERCAGTPLRGEGGSAPFYPPGLFGSHKLVRRCEAGDEVQAVRAVLERGRGRVALGRKAAAFRLPD